MSTASIAAQPGTPSDVTSLSIPLRNLLITLALTIGTLALAGYLWRDQGYEILIVTMGWPHVLLGFVFYFGRVRRGEASARAAFPMLALLTLLIWTLHYNYTITGLIYLYFLYHAFRDEIFVFLQTRARHRFGSSVYAVAGVSTAILVLLLIPKPGYFRNDLRRTEFTGAQVVQGGWTFIPFRLVPNSRGREYYFYLQSPQTAGLETFATGATTSTTPDRHSILVNDHEWPNGGDLLFKLHYAGETITGEDAKAIDVPVLLTGGHSVGETFIAARDNMDGIMVPINRLAGATDATPFVLHLASPPLLPYPDSFNYLRVAVALGLALVLLWRLFGPGRGKQQLWVCLLVLTFGMMIVRTVLKTSNTAGWAFPVLFQFVVVYHYWSWYVFSFDKISAHKQSTLAPPVFTNNYDRLLGYLRQGRYFVTAMIAMTLISGLGVFWYYKLEGPPGLRFAFDYNYFLYALVFHVSFSFNPKPRTGFKQKETKTLSHNEEQPAMN